ncbi:hypothetical protein [Actinoplanes sp. NPDC049599]|uniref:hypothetical protein n=1 Tax=Actinoplanes sp. NPDC049599 TaxID=3363903 RepID=UPI0037BDB99D
MNENDLREAMRASMTITPPPPMESAVAVAAGRRAVRRRATLTGAGAAAAVLAVTALAVPGLRLTSGAGGGDSPWAGQPPAATGSVPAPLGTPPADEATKPVWPLDGDGQPQEDATARSGERYNQGKELLAQLLTAVPDGWTAPQGDAAPGLRLRDHQAQVEGDNSGRTWSYLASAAVAKDGRTGRLLAEVHTKDNGLPTDPCALARQFWGMGGTCTVVTVGKKKVGVTKAAPGDDRLDQWAAYRHSDGTVVYVAQSKYAANVETALKPLKELPLSRQELAGVATDDRFHLS